MLGKYCTLRSRDKVDEEKQLFLLAREGKLYYSLLVEDNLLVDYVIHKITGPLIEEALDSTEKVLAEVRALAAEGKRILGIEDDIEKHLFSFTHNPSEQYLTIDYNKEEYWDQEESSEDSYEDYEESE